MAPQTLRTIIALVLVVHGIGHTMGVLSAFEISNLSYWNSRSWLLDDVLGTPLSRAVCVAGYALLVIAFLVTGLALLDWGVPHDWWRPLATVSAIASLVMQALYWNAFVELVPNKIGALAVNVAVVAGLLIANWPTESDIGF